MEYFNPKLEDYTIDDIPYFLANGDISKFESILNSPVSRVFRAYYMKRVEKLNEEKEALDTLVSMNKP